MTKAPGKPGTGTPESTHVSSAPVNHRRRRLLLSLSAGGAAGAAAVVASTSAVAVVATPASAEPAEQSQGYRETDHVRDYYRTARL